MAFFQTGFYATARILLLFLGGCAAVVLLLGVVVLALIIAAVVFDWITNSLARRWTKNGHKPRSKLERIILDAFQRRDG